MLRLEDLTVQYDRDLPPAVDRVNLTVPVGEILGLVGESGCGKSTLGRSLLGLLPKSAQVSGQVSLTLANSQVLGLKDFQRGRQIGLIFQDPLTRLNPLLTIAAHGIEVVQSHFPRLTKTEARAKFAHALTQVNIDRDRADQYPHQFSGGMRQRVAIALALVLEPVVLIADEPTTSLDVTIAAEILTELTQLRSRMAIILITHDLGLVAQYCDRVAVMYGGAIVEIGKSKQVLHQPQQQYTQTLVQSIKRFVPAPPSSSLISPCPLLLEVQNLSKFYGRSHLPWQKSKLGVKALDQVSFKIYRGDRLGMIGESGSGKSSTARGILRLIQLDQGQVWFGQKELLGLKTEGMRRFRPQLQMIFQDPRASLPPHLSISRAVADPLLIHGLVPNYRQALPQVHEILGRVGIDRALHDRLPHQLSGGQLQRVAIARALITKPQLLICDEPVSMLDATIQTQILALMLELQAEFELTYLFITHDLGVAQYFCNRLAVMYQGKIVEQGEADRLFWQPQHPYTQTLLRAVQGL
ncbi:MAG: ABC transporter ATP-binding protein [Pseudanabaenaceae cyanobacterium bins.68]|nr:ABC transporter ATP-binding protein [Pseudanabaenaceae cyanobacterium bins.68]